MASFKVNSSSYKALPQITIITRISHGEIIQKDKKATVCKISVIDNGPGISEEIKDSIFFPMITGKDKDVREHIQVKNYNDDRKALLPFKKEITAKLYER